jgi:hypothetical protein
MFAADQFRLAPKQKFLFHVSFSINDAALKLIDINQRYRNEINMLVKSTDLPRYTVSNEMLNQYNRKKVVQFTHKPEPINMKFHDDNMSLISQLWWNYYTYYYADSSSADVGGAYDRNAMRNFDFTPTPYGLDNNSTVPFFNYIKIYQMARHEFICYTLINPTISSWGHGNVSYTDNNLNEQSLTIMYESVAYTTGDMLTEPPEGFAVEHYDNTPSPLKGAGNFNSASPSFAKGLNVAGSAESFLNTVITQVNTAQNTKTVSNTSASNKAQATQQTLNGLQGFSFPVSK